MPQTNAGYWFVTHWGPFGRGRQNALDTAIQERVAQLVERLEATLNTALDAIQAQNDPARLMQLNNAIRDLNAMGVPGLENVPEADANAAHYNLLAPYQQGAPHAPREHQLLGTVLRDDNMGAPCLEDIIDAIQAAQPPPPRRQFVNVWARNGAGPARHDGGGRKKRSSQPDKEFGATLNIVDSDQNSDFVITKIEFKEMYGGQMETHLVDFERKAFIPDPNKSGSQMKTEFTVNNKVVPSTVEENPVTTYKIVLRPRGN